MRVIFEKEPHVNALMCTSPKNNCSNIFPLVKETYDDTTFLDKVRVITAPGNCRSFGNLWNDEELDKPGQLFYSFFITTDELKKNMNEFACVTEDAIKIYDK